MAPNPRILWGPTFENELIFAHPPYSPVTDREPREGSEWLQGASGTEDAWITGRDYTLDFDARFLEHDGASGTPLGGPTGWQAFLDAARDKQPFRFVPDEALPEFYVPDCRLVEPLRGFGEMRDYRRQVHLKIRNPAVDFVQALRGLMFEYAPGGSLTDPVVASFTRATAATYRGLPGTLAAAVGASAASGVLRDRHYEGSVRTTSLEQGRTQLVTDPENFGNWALSNTPNRTGGQADPFGGTAAYLLEDDSASLEEGISQVVTFTGDATKCISCFFRQGTATDLHLGIFNGTVWRHRVRVRWTGGIPVLTTQAGAGTLYPVENWGGGWWRCSIGVDGVVAAETNTFFLRTESVGVTGTWYIFGANAWNAAWPKSYQPPGAGSVNDQFTWPHVHRPQASFWYVKLFHRTLAGLGTTARVVAVGNGSFTAPQFLIYINTSNGRYEVMHHSASGSDLTSVPAVTPAWGDVVEVLGVLTSDGRVQGYTSINGAADVVGALSAASPLPPAWSGPVSLSINSSPDGADPGYGSYVSVKVGPLTFAGVTVDTIAKARVR